MSTRPNARLIETVWTDRAREAFPCSGDLALWRGGLIMALQPPRKHRNLAATRSPGSMFTRLPGLLLPWG
jgi:hypothetical protein